MYDVLKSSKGLSAKLKTEFKSAVAALFPTLYHVIKGTQLSKTSATLLLIITLLSDLIFPLLLHFSDEVGVGS